MVNTEKAFQSEKHLAYEIDKLAQFTYALSFDDIPEPVTDRTELMLFDLIGSTLSGMGTSEMQSLVNSWYLPEGTHRLLGTRHDTDPATSAYLLAIAACILELDEGNKHAAGHPAAHVVFAALAASFQYRPNISGQALFAAIIAGYEVAARFGRALSREPAWHTHGHWGACGAAAAAAKIMGCTSRQIAAAIDTSGAFLSVTPWRHVLAGDFSRNLWMARANLAGLEAATLARAGLAQNRGLLHESLGTIIGSIDADGLTHNLRSDWLVNQGYLKRHASCSYTHTAIDLIQILRADTRWQPSDISSIVIRTNSLASALTGRHPHNRLAAMFSLPFVAAMAATTGRVDATVMEPSANTFTAAEEFSDRVEVIIDTGLDRWLPTARVTEVRVAFLDGHEVHIAQPNPIGDSDFHPLNTSDVHHKLAGLIGHNHASAVHTFAQQLHQGNDLASALTDLDLSLTIVPAAR